MALNPETVRPDHMDIILAILKSAGGAVAGRARLTRSVYLLDHLGLESGFRYRCDRHGPFSRGIDNALAGAMASCLVVSEGGRVRFGDRCPDGRRTEPDSALEGSGDEILRLVADGTWQGPSGLDIRLQWALRSFIDANAAVLRTAATVHWLAEREGVEDWPAELIRRGHVRAMGACTDLALTLLHGAGLPPGRDIRAGSMPPNEWRHQKEVAAAFYTPELVDELKRGTRGTCG